MFAIIHGEGVIPDRRTRESFTGSQWEIIEQLFENHSLDEILEDRIPDEEFSADEKAKLISKLKSKAPISARLRILESKLSDTFAAGWSKGSILRR